MDVDGMKLTLLERARQDSRGHNRDSIWDRFNFYEGNWPIPFAGYTTETVLESPIVIECWKYTNEQMTSGFTAPKDELRYLKEDDIPTWLEQAPQGGRQLCASMRLIHKFYDSSSHRDPLNKQTFAAINDKFGLPNVFSHPKTTLVGGCGKFTSVDSQSVVFVCRSMFALAAVSTVVRYNFETDTTLGYLISEKGAMIHHNLLGIPRKFRILTHPLLVPFLVGEHMLEEATDNLLHIDGMIVDIEDSTGFHGYEKRENHSSLQDYRELSRYLGDAASKFAFLKSRILVTKNLHDFLFRELKSCQAWIPKSRWQEYAGSTRILTERAEYTKSHIENLLHYRGIEMRLQAQQSVIFNLIAQEDNRTNIQLSDEMRRLAIKTKRDGSIMKTIAFLGALFVPATFVSTLFAMPLFDWSAPTMSEIITARFWIYGAVTGPLTVVTIAIVGYWIMSRNQKNWEDNRTPGYGKRPSMFRHW